jgi:eukaryotic-like serine/threonine-protein kinase
MIGRVVGNYRIVSQIGEGGMGTVYRAVDTMLDREVALKAIRSDLSQEPHMVERFRTEAKTLARIHHPAIATIFAFFKEGEELFLAMEYIPSGSLSKILEAEGALPWPRAVSLLSSALDGIEAAHRAGVVHRDLKPDNLLLTEAGTLKVTDFGLARMVGSSRLTRTGISLGTLRYMAPEQIQGGEVDARTDVYALGTVLYQMLTGCVPFEGESDYSILKAQVEDTPVPPSEHVPNLPGWLDRIVLKALEKDPARRFQSVGELQAALTREETTRAGGFKVPPPEDLEDLPTLVLPRSPLAAKAAPTTRTGPPPVPPALPAPPPAASYRSVEIPRPSNWKGSGALGLGIAAVLLVAFAGLFLWNREKAPQQAAVLEPEPTPIQEPLQTGQPEPEPEFAAQETVVAAPQPRSSSTLRKDPPAPAPPPRLSTPDPVTEVPEEKVEVKPAPVEETADAEPAPDPVGAAHEDLHQIGPELVTGSEHLVEVYEAFLEQKEDGGAELTETDEKLLEELEVLGEAAERFNKKLKDGFIARLRNRGADEKRAEVARRARELANAGERVERLMAEVRPSSEVRQAWQDVKRRWQRAVELAGR